MAVVLEASGEDDCQRTFAMAPGEGQKALDEPMTSSTRTVTRTKCNMVGGPQILKESKEENSTQVRVAVSDGMRGGGRGHWYAVVRLSVTRIRAVNDR